MKTLKLLLLLALIAVPAFPADIKTGEDVVAAMYKKYAGKWYKTLTFVQKTTTHKPDGTESAETWYEAMTVPGKLRIDIVPLDKGNGIIFADGKVSSFRDGKLVGSRPFIHPLLVLGFDVYGQPVETTINQIKSLGVDMATVHQDKWQGRDVYVVGAKQGDLTVPQFWVDKKDLLFVRLFQLGGRDKKIVQETQFNKYVKVKGGGWVSAEVKFYNDGKLATSEDYTDIQTGMALSSDLWDPEKWLTVDKSYYKKQ
jgi:outer membrane lipoprotein-sorting protein